MPPFPGAPFTVPTYRNIDRSRHYGLEAGFGVRLGRDVRAQLAYTYARYEFVKDSLYAGKRIPGAPGHMVSAELNYLNPRGLSLAPRVDWVPQAYNVDNANTAGTTAWITLGLRAEYMVGTTGLRVFGDVRNIADAKYSGSVQVNDANGRFFEPADGRAVSVGLRYER